MGRNCGIAIGINRYDNLQDLTCARRDAEAVAEFFRDELHCETVYHFAEDAPLIQTPNGSLSSQPTYGKLKRFLRTRFDRPFLHAGDNLWFFFAGHGVHHEGRDYLMPLDADPGEVEDTAIPVSYVTERLRRCGADNVVLLVDACRSASRAGLGIGNEAPMGVITLFSCRPHERSYEIEDPSVRHGAFTYALLQGLRLQGEGNCATVERLDAYLSHQVPELNRRYQKPVQTPYAIVEPASKYHLILLPRQATLRDTETLKLEAFRAERAGDYELAEQLWIRVLIVSPGDLDAIEGVRRTDPKTPRKPATSPPPSVQPVVERATDSTSTPRSDSSPQTTKPPSSSQPTTGMPEVDRSINAAPPRNTPKPRSTTPPASSIQPPSVQPVIGRTAESTLSSPRIKPKPQPAKPQSPSSQPSSRSDKKLSQTSATQTTQQLKSEFEATQSKLSRRKVLQIAGITAGSGVGVVLLTRAFQNSRNRDITSQENDLFQTGSAEETEAPVSNEVADLPNLNPERIIDASRVEFNVASVDERGKLITPVERKQAEYRREELGNGIVLDLMSIPADTFMMGSPEDELERFDDEGPQREVAISAFLMGKYAVTQAQWRTVAAMEKVERDLSADPSSFKGEDRPVESVSWEDATEFCARLSAQTGRTYRLPSEAEWEYACRAGTTTPFHFGKTISPQLANYNGNSKYGSGPTGQYRGSTTPVGSFGVANNFGLYDMHGNVWEWCEDVWHENYAGAPPGGTPWMEGGDQNRGVLRGGSWRNFPRGCRSAFRGRNRPDYQDNGFGFRVACSPAWGLP
ncbi:MAG: SUMF1/EgtB/PvdO family nonheme iron enzyme [Cyanobacteria bacterium P01_F01_bin.33]